MSKQPARYSLSDFICSNRGAQFVIPVYQRNYSWNPEKETRQFMDDMEHLLHTSSTHFLGILIYVLNEETVPVQLMVVDGQQRLTTVLLILAACYEGKSNKLPYDIVYANNRSEIDDYYIDRAKETIREWFKRFDELRADDVRYELQRKIHSYIQFIWYQVPDGATHAKPNFPHAWYKQ